jgi:hypothetical protein
MKFNVGDILVSSQSSTTILLTGKDQYEYHYKVLMIRNGIASSELHYNSRQLKLLTEQPYNYIHHPVKD